MIRTLWLRFKSFGMIGWVLAAALLGLVFLILRKTFIGEDKPSDEVQTLKNFVEEKAAELKIANTKAALEIAAERNEDAKLKKDLNKALAIEDTEARLKKLTQLKTRLR